MSGKLPAGKECASEGRPIESFEQRHQQRANTPPVGPVTPKEAPDAGATRAYAYDPQLDPQLQGHGKGHHASREVTTVPRADHQKTSSVERLSRPTPRNDILVVETRGHDQQIVCTCYDRV